MYKIGTAWESNLLAFKHEKTVKNWNKCKKTTNRNASNIFSISAFDKPNGVAEKLMGDNPFGNVSSGGKRMGIFIRGIVVVAPVLVIP